MKIISFIGKKKVRKAGGVGYLFFTNLFSIMYFSLKCCKVGGGGKGEVENV